PARLRRRGRGLLVHRAGAAVVSKYQKLVDEQAAVMGVQTLPVEHENEGSAATDLSKLFINPEFAGTLDSGSPAAMRFVVAHELADDRAGAGDGHEGELQADRWAAHSLVHAGFGPEAIEGVMAHLDNSDSESHPGAQRRLTNARAAWHAANEAQATPRRGLDRESMRDR